MKLSTYPVLMAATAKKRYIPAMVEINRLMVTSSNSLTNPVYSQIVIPVINVKRKINASGRNTIPTIMIAKKMTPLIERMIKFFCLSLIANGFYLN